MEKCIIMMANLNSNLKTKVQKECIFSNIFLLYINSQNIIKEVFSYLSEKQILKLIIYNKHLQNKLDITINDYKRISRKYKEGGRNGKGKEYDKVANIVQFEGEYLNGKRNGKGKEYYNDGKLKYEGEYLNGKRI